MIEFNNVTKCYQRGEDVLRDVTFKIEPYEMAFLTGHSGAGKTTLLKLIAAIEPVSSGQILVDGKNLKNLSANQIAKLRQSIGIVLQDPMLLEDLSIAENVALPLHVIGFREKEIKGRVNAALEMVELSKKEKRLPAALSAGEKQRVGIARAIVTRPAIILADEPTGNLDPGLASEIMDLFVRFNQAKVSVLVATHNLALIARLPYRILTLNRGVLTKNGKTL